MIQIGQFTVILQNRTFTAIVGLALQLEILKQQENVLQKPNVTENLMNWKHVGSGIEM